MNLKTLFSSISVLALSACISAPQTEPAPVQTLETEALNATPQTAPVMQQENLLRQRMELAGRSQMAAKSHSSYVIADAVSQTAWLPPVGNREAYDHISENDFQNPTLSPLSTFGLDVDTASYSNVRRFLVQGQRPPVDSVRVEELINYFDYDYPKVQGRHPLNIVSEMAPAPWNPQNRLVLIGVQAKDLSPAEETPNRLVFLIDTSGSMNQQNKLPLLKRSFMKLVEKLDADDSVAIVTYAGSAGVVLPATSGANKEAIYAALNRLHAGGSTAGAQGITLAYELAKKQYRAKANNRVILATDGDFNVGPNSESDLVNMIEDRRDDGIFLSVLGFGTGNYQETKMQQLSSHGNGTHYYINTDQEAQRIFGEKLQGSLYTVAKDVKIQIEWNPKQVGAYRLIGYENRMLNAEDFKDDRKDAGDVGAGHTVTALYEIEPPAGSDAEPLRYQERRITPSSKQNELGMLKLRYKPDSQSASIEVSQVISTSRQSGSDNWQWAAVVAEFGMLLRESEHKADADFDQLITRAEKLVAGQALREEFIALARQAKLAMNRLDAPTVQPHFHSKMSLPRMQAAVQ